MRTPVAFIIFNRPDTTKHVFAEIARAKPRKLFVIADGPRRDHPEDSGKCAAAREIVERVDWECEVLKNYSNANLGCGYRPATGISWVFEQEEEAVILEDDCVPHSTFFPFCEELLEKYRHDERVMQISGFNSLSGRRSMPYSYSFYRNFACWGWATWRRAWRYHDMEMKLWPELRNTNWLQDVVGDLRATEHWKQIFDAAHSNSATIDYWDYQFLFACWAQSGLAISPATNLVANIGFRADATHTKSANASCGNISSAEMRFPLTHPPYMVRDRGADQFHLEQVLEQMPEKRWSLMPYRKLHKRLSNMIRELIRK